MPSVFVAGWRVVDLDSRNGVTFEGRKVPMAPLVEGGVIMLGDIELRFRAEDASTSAAPIVLAPAPRASAPLVPDALAPETTLSTTEFRPPAPPPPPVDDGEIELEGDWEDVVPPPTTAGRPRIEAPAPAEPRRAPVQPGASAAAQRERDARRAELLRGTRASAEPKAAAGTRPVLQYHRTEGSSGILGADLAQRPWWVRAAVWLVGVTLLAGIAYGALELTRKLRADEATLGAPRVDDGAGE
jgi:hypothetical protein